MTEELIVYVQGLFGQTVLHDLLQIANQETILPTTRDTLDRTLIEHNSAAVALVTGRPSWDLADALDVRCFDARVPFIPVTCVGTSLLIGPIVLPGISCCFQCWATRDVHANRAAYAVQRRRFFTDHPEADPIGHLASHSRTAAALLLQEWNHVKRDGTNAGEIIKMDMVTQSIRTYRAIGVDNCPRCGLGRDERTRSYAGLRAALATVVPNHRLRAVDNA